MELPPADCDDHARRIDTGGLGDHFGLFLDNPLKASIFAERRPVESVALDLG